jgi:hypothetical protein
MGRTKRLFVQQCQNSDAKKVNWWPAGSYLVIQVFASLPNMLEPLLDALLAVLASNRVFELFLETCVNVFGREMLLAEKPNDNSLIALHQLNEKP